MTDLTDEELERRMRRKLLLDGASSRGEQFTPEQQAIADKLIGKHNVERLERRRDFSSNVRRSPRPFRPTPVSIIYEYWWVNGGEHMSYWNMARVENGKRSDHSYTLDIMDEISRLKAAGFTVKEIRIEGAPSLVERSKPRPMPCRKSFSERFGDFDPEVDGR
jgi:hypothetical protein